LVGAQPVWAWVLAVGGSALVTFGVVAQIAPFRYLPSGVFLVVVIGAAALGGLRPGLVASVLSSLGIWYAVLPPKNSFGVQSLGEGFEELAALAFFLVTALAASAFVERLERALDDAQEARLRVDFLARASEVLGSSLDVDATLRRLARLSVDVLAEWGTVALVDEEGVRRVAVAHRHPSRQHELEAVPADAAPMFPPELVERVAHGETVVGEFDDDSLRASASDGRTLQLLRSLAPRSFLVAPLRSGTGVIGALSFARGRDLPPFVAADTELADELARRASVAIENARLYQSRDRATERLALLNEASRALASTLDIATAFRRMGEALVPDLADLCYLDLVEEEGTRRLVVANPALGDATSLERWPPDPRGRNPIAEVIARGEPTVLVELTEEVLARVARDDDHLEMIRRLGIHSVIIVPLVTQGHVVGALSLLRAAEGARYAPADLSVVEVLGRRVSMAVENGRLFAGQRELAETLQRSLLPPVLPSVPGVAVAVRYLPAGAAMDVGGDWYDAFTVRAGLLAFALGDVAGHGAHSASVMGQLRNALRAYMIEDPDPARVLARLDALLAALEPDEMATLTCGTLDPERGELRLSSAGHLQPLLVDRDGRGSRLDQERGVPLGTGAPVHYRTTTIRLRPGDTFVLFTDGLVEDRRRPLDVGLERLVDVASTREHPGDPAALCDALVDGMLGGTNGEDDVAVLAVRLEELGAHLYLDVPADPSVLASTRRTLRRWLHGVGVGEVETTKVLAAVGEACANAIEHGSNGAYPTRASMPSFVLEGMVDDDGLCVHVRDRGRWRAPRGGNRGRGLLLMHALSDDVVVDTDEVGTDVTLRWRHQAAVT
jgi:serine phosphatase RsbU (regulator of sigma subunit)